MPSAEGSLRAACGKGREGIVLAIVENSTKSEKAFTGLNITLLCVLSFMFVYPMWHVLMASFSDPISLIGFKGLLAKPIGFSLEGYKIVLKNKNIYVGYGNTLFYVVVGTFINMLLTVVGAYCLSRKRTILMRPLTLLIVFTMYVDFGLVPSFLNIRDLGLYGSRWALILPGAIGTYNMIVMRTALNAIPQSLEESAMIDGAGHFSILFKILLPVSKATLAVLTLFYAVGHWNSWFTAAIYLRDRKKFPLQLFLREILIAQSTATGTGEGSSVDGFLYLDELIKYCTIIVSTVPILCLYPFVQRYFMTGVMLGSVKE